MATATEYPDTITWGRCRTGRRFFWTARNLTADTELYDWADTRDQAEQQAHVAALKLADGQYASIRVLHAAATSKLKAINAAKRKAKPLSDSTESSPITYLYGTFDTEDDRGRLVTQVASFRIVRRTRQRVYYVRREHPDGSVQLGYVDRQTLDAEGHVRNYAAGGWWAPDFHLYAQPPDVEQGHVAPAPNLKTLKQAMRAAHPDVGGSDESFIRARAAYEHARARTKGKTR